MTEAERHNRLKQRIADLMHGVRMPTKVISTAMKLGVGEKESMEYAETFRNPTSVMEIGEQFPDSPTTEEFMGWYLKQEVLIRRIHEDTDAEDFSSEEDSIGEKWSGYTDE